MLTRGSTFVRDQGQSLDLDCMFAYDEYNVFRNPIVWKKRQLKETVPINLNKNIYQPFLDTRRFEISLSIAGSSSNSTVSVASAASAALTVKRVASDSQASPMSASAVADKRTVVHEQLRLSNVTAQDSGDYICEVKGSQSVVMATVIHHVIVRTAVQRLLLFTDNSAASNRRSYDYKPRNLQPDFMDTISSWSAKLKNHHHHHPNHHHHNHRLRQRPQVPLNHRGRKVDPADRGRLPEVVITQGHPRGLGCLATGGSPAPEVRIYVGNKEFTDFFALEQVLTLVSTTTGGRGHRGYDDDDGGDDGGDRDDDDNYDYDDDDDDDEDENAYDDYLDADDEDGGARSRKTWRRQLELKDPRKRHHPHNEPEAKVKERRRNKLPPGLQLLRWSTKRWSNTGAGLHLRDEQLDGQVIRCTAVVSGLQLPPEVEPVVVARVTMHYAPKITCVTSSAHVGEKNVDLRCQVRSKPDLTALFWTTDTSGTTVVSPDKEADEFWSVNRVKNDTLVETALHIRTVKEEHFRSYRLVAENGVSTATAEVQLKTKRLEVTASPKSPKSANHVAASVRRYDALANQNDRDIYRFSVMTSSGTRMEFWIFQSSFCFAIVHLSRGSARRD